MRTGSCISGNNRDTSEIDGEIRATGDGGGVLVSLGEFEMTGGTISGNTANSGGGVYSIVGMVGQSGLFTMYGGTISGNIANDGGGVRDLWKMHGGTISGNTANFNGGGVWHLNNMEGGIITGNTARMSGGGVYDRLLHPRSIGGTITGYGSDPVNGNAVKDKDGNVLSKPVDKDGNVVQCQTRERKFEPCNSVGHAVFTNWNNDEFFSIGIKDKTITGPYRK
jgi:parallel beta-helix repeat protein